ncbi:MAG: hypothetical protein EA402_07870 [Planctomycetota bacterium]|nr:MAG: hypothetical protein EA402_07870 [Planctomycetota bacterium]
MHSLVSRVVDVQEAILAAARARDLDAAREALFIDLLITMSSNRCAAMADGMPDRQKTELRALGYA